MFCRILNFSILFVNLKCAKIFDYNILHSAQAKTEPNIEQNRATGIAYKSFLILVCDIYIVVT